jgi:chemotaxis protein MotB
MNEYKQTKEKLADAHEILEEQYKIMQQIEDKINEALADFKDKGVEVYFRKGLVHVSMEDNLLYKSGSSRLDEKGKKALTNLAVVLNEYPNLKVIVLGNTDDVKFKNGMDNWTLSTERANGVVRILRDVCKMDPLRLTAAGKGKYNPVADNATEEGRAKNRRTDIILNPDLDRLWDSIEN